jgi:hypothetical protein
MSNSYGMPPEVEQEIRARDKLCAYCGVSMEQKRSAREATIEHFDNDGPFNQKDNAAICCHGCNSSKRARKLLAWFETPYCTRKNINRETVADVVKEYIRSL